MAGATGGSGGAPEGADDGGSGCWPGWIPVSAQQEIKARCPNPRNWDALRRTINQVLSRHGEFIQQNGLTGPQIAEMAQGLNPTAVTGVRGKRVKMEWDHYRERQEIGSDPYDLANLRLVTPDGHIQKLGHKFNVESFLRRQGLIKERPRRKAKPGQD